MAHRYRDRELEITFEAPPSDYMVPLAGCVIRRMSQSGTDSVSINEYARTYEADFPSEIHEVSRLARLMRTFRKRVWCGGKVYVFHENERRRKYERTKFIVRAEGQPPNVGIVIGANHMPRDVYADEGPVSAALREVAPVGGPLQLDRTESLPLGEVYARLDAGERRLQALEERGEPVADLSAFRLSLEADFQAFDKRLADFKSEMDRLGMSLRSETARLAKSLEDLRSDCGGLYNQIQAVARRPSPSDI